MKRWLVLFTAMVLMTGCGKQENKETKEVNQNHVKASYIASFSKQSGAMGTYGGTQMITLYEDGNARIYHGFHGNAVGTKKELSLGNYDKEKYVKGVLELTYQAEEEKKTVTAQITDKKFRAQVFLITTMPDDGKEEEKGLTFYEIEPTQISSDAEYVYSGTNQYKEHYTACYLELRKDQSVNLTMNVDGILSTDMGTYEIVDGSLEKEAMLVLTFGENVLEIPYDNTENIQTEFTEEGINALRVNLIALKSK